MNINKINLNFIYQENGFTLVEVLVSMVVLSVGILGSLTLMTNILHNSQLLENQGIAQHIMQEGLEVVVNIRNENFLTRSNEAADDNSDNSKVKYDKNLVEDDYCIEYDFKNPSEGKGIDNVTKQQLVPIDASNCDICISDNDEIYSKVTSSIPCIGVEFTRKINIEKVTVDPVSIPPGNGSTQNQLNNANNSINKTYLKVTSTVEWDDGGERSIEGILRLYDYLPQNN